MARERKTKPFVPWYTLEDNERWVLGAEGRYFVNMEGEVWLCEWIASNRQTARELWDNVYSLDKKHRMKIADAFVFNHGWSYKNLD